VEETGAVAEEHEEGAETDGGPEDPADERPGADDARTDGQTDRQTDATESLMTRGTPCNDVV